MLHGYRQLYSLDKKKTKFLQTLQKVLKEDFIIQVINQINHSCLADDNDKQTKTKDTKMFVIKRKLKFQDY